MDGMSYEWIKSVYLLLIILFTFFFIILCPTTTTSSLFLIMLQDLIYFRIRCCRLSTWLTNHEQNHEKHFIFLQEKNTNNSMNKTMRKTLLFLKKKKKQQLNLTWLGIFFSHFFKIFYIFFEYPYSLQRKWLKLERKSRP